MTTSERRAYKLRYYHENKHKWVARSPDKVARDKSRKLEKYYGITIEQRDALEEAQGGLCAICCRRSTKTLHVDHCHYTGIVRGLLCEDCNLGLGRFKDDTGLTLRAHFYLLQHNTRKGCQFNGEDS